jgi:serine/threonine protein kinase
MHEQGVAHRYGLLKRSPECVLIRRSDCARSNIMMDASALFPYGYHPVHSMYLPDIRGRAPHYSRAAVSVRYYYTDFGISSHFPQDARSTLVVGRLGRDQYVPELSIDVPYDPFKVDIYILGNVLFFAFEMVCAPLSAWVHNIHAMDRNT